MFYKSTRSAPENWTQTFSFGLLFRPLQTKYDLKRAPVCNLMVARSVKEMLRKNVRETHLTLKSKMFSNFLKNGPRSF